MNIFLPKVRSVICIFICILLSLFIKLFTDLNMVIIIEILLFIPGFILSYILSTKLDIRISHFLFYIIVFLSFLLVSSFSKSSIALNISIQDWERKVIKNLDNECSLTCIIKNRTIYDENNNEVYSWHGLSYIYGGEIIKNNDSLEYKISLENKCIVKLSNEKYKIINNKCD